MTSTPWQVRIDDVFRIPLRPRPLFTGRIESGVVHTGDAFHTADGRIGRVGSIDFLCGPNVAPDAIAFTADIELMPGDVIMSDGQSTKSPTS